MAEAVRVEGLAQLRRDLRAMPADQRREVTKALKRGAEEVAETARPLAAFRTGRLAGSYRASAAGNTAVVRSRLPYAAVQEFGGTIKPRGTPITIQPRAAVTTALERNEDKVVDLIAAALDAVATRFGWR